MYFLQGLLVGLATFAPVGMQNLFIINTALVQPVRRIILTLAILALFDMSLSAAAFYGIGAVLEMWPIMKLIVILFGSLLIIYMGSNIFRTEPDVRNLNTHIPIRKLIMSAIAVSWGNPQAVLDATMLLGAFQAHIPKEEVYYFFGGFLAMTPIWFGSLATVMHLLAKKIKISHMVWINRFCGTVLTIYGIKLFIDGVTMLLEFF